MIHPAERVLKFVEVASLGIKKAKDENDIHRAQQIKAAALRPAVLKKLADSKLVADENIKAAEAMLGDHHGSLSLLNMAVDRILQQRSDIQKMASDENGVAVSEEKAGISKTAGDRHSVKGNDALLALIRKN